MIKILVLGVMVGGAGALGYFGERFLRLTGAGSPEHPIVDRKSELMYKMPLGGFTMQVMQRKRSLHLVFDIDVYVMGAASFQEINGALGRARLRDATVAAIADLAETDMSFRKPVTDDASKVALAEKIVRKLYVNFPIVRTARINRFIAKTSARE